MLLLAVDTSGKNGSLALACVTDGADEAEIIEVVPLAGGTFSAQLVPQIATLLAKHKYTKSDLDAFAATTGPGSFTGLRVGLAAIKALADALAKPIAAVSLLEVIAWSSGVHGHILVGLDAGRGEVYVGEYQVHGNNALPLALSERLLRREELLAQAQGKIVVTTDSQLAEALRAARLHCEIVNHPGSAGVARLGWERIRRGETVRAEDLEANYIRRSDAEIFSPPKR
jgi:tRNA threonylcarbamoyladenosine biosynthesis protein TsaB